MKSRLVRSQKLRSSLATFWHPHILNLGGNSPADGTSKQRWDRIPNLLILFNDVARKDVVVWK
jgi:hypothetical protein